MLYITCIPYRYHIFSIHHIRHIRLIQLFITMLITIYETNDPNNPKHCWQHLNFAQSSHLRESLFFYFFFKMTFMLFQVQNKFVLKYNHVQEKNYCLRPKYCICRLFNNKVARRNIIFIVSNLIASKYIFHIKYHIYCRI